jgi:predicted DsbA family dithiol-disulfide isomerase
MNPTTDTPAPAGPLVIDVISDVVCPWCYIGKRNLEDALARWAEAHPEAPPPTVQWRPFQLNPGLAATGMSRRDYVQRKFGAQGAANYARVAAVGAEAGIAFAFDAIERQPNTLAPHALIGAAGEVGLQEAMVEALFRAYFLEGRDMTDRATLVAVAERAGFSRTQAESVLDSREAQETAAAEDEQARAMGVSGVPFFIFNGRVAVSGAHPADTLYDAMRQAAVPSGAAGSAT